MAINLQRLLSISSPHAKYTVKVGVENGKHLFVLKDFSEALDRMTDNDQGPDNEYDRANELYDQAKDRVYNEDPPDASTIDILEAFLAISVERGLIKLELSTEKINKFL